MPVKQAATIPLICKSYGLPEPVAEYRFDHARRWRFDWAWLNGSQIALEIEGGVFMQGRHTRGLGVVKDMEKYNRATLLGWKVLRCTPRDVKSGAVADLLCEALR
jgi:hypothetical protein